MVKQVRFGAQKSAIWILKFFNSLPLFVDKLFSLNIFLNLLLVVLFISLNDSGNYKCYKLSLEIESQLFKLQLYELVHGYYLSSIYKIHYEENPYLKMGGNLPNWEVKLRN